MICFCLCDAVMQSMVLVVGMAVVVAVVAGVALLVAGTAQGSGSGSSWQGSDAFGYAPPQGFGPPQMPAAPHFSPGYFMAPPGPGPAQVVKAMGAPAQAPAVRGKCFCCHEFHDFQAQCPLRALGGPPSGSM